MSTYLAIHPAVHGCGSHDPGAVIFSDGELVFGIEEERLTRDKHAPLRFPDRSVRACLSYCGITLPEVDRILVPWQPRDQTVIQRIERRLSEAGTPVPPVETYNHHRCHAASAFFPSGFDESLVLTSDGQGEADSTVVWHGTGRRLDRLRTYETPNSLGYLYAAATGYLGYRIFDGEGSAMALAAYGERNSEIEETLETVIEGGVDYDVRQVVGGGVPAGIARFEELFGRPRTHTRGSEDEWASDFAFAIQRAVEEIVVAVIETYCERVGVTTVCLAGGVALNCKLNKRVADSPLVERLFVQPIAHDAGSPIGAGLLANEENAMNTVFLGPSFSDEEIEALLLQREIAYERPTDIEREVATRLADGAIVGWFQGRTELGPRALGNRSILADPRAVATRNRLNAFVKHRAPWRPFSPSILDEAATEFLRSPRPAPYMIQAFDLRPEKRATVPAVIHPADGTTRPQIVEKETSPRYHRLLSMFEELTGVPVLLNTSFNDSGEPIVNTPQEALDAFSTMNLDAVAIEGFLIER